MKTLFVISFLKFEPLCRRTIAVICNKRCANRKRAVASRNKEATATRKHMKIKSKTKQDAVLAEGTYNSALSSVTPKPTEAEPKKIDIGFQPEGYDKEIHKEYPAAFNEGSPLRADVETLLGRALTRDEENHGFELNTLIGTKCQVAVFHTSGSGGRLKPTVSLVLAANS